MDFSKRAPSTTLGSPKRQPADFTMPVTHKAHQGTAQSNAGIGKSVPTGKR